MTTKPTPSPWANNGGPRAGAGKPRKFDAPARNYTVRLTDAQAEKLRKIGGSVGNGVHVLLGYSK